ncbi:MAG TPA: glycosyltransferase [Thermoanaerobaculia bacterium]|jgi:GT2 family glycosyltransferase
MRPDWEKGLRGRLYALGRRIVPLSWRRAVRRRFAPEKLLGIRKPPVDIPRYEFDPNEARPGRPDVLVLPVIAWSYRRQRPQQLAEALARRGHRVFYGSLEGEGEPAQATGVAPGVTLLPIAGVKREDPADRRLKGSALERTAVALARARDRFEIHEATLLVQSPFWTPLARALAEQFGWKIVYDCLDEHSAFSANRPEALAAAETELVGAADLVFGTSGPLVERLRKSRPDARHLGNAADAKLFGALSDPAPDPGRLTVGYAGAVDDWFDFGLLAQVARLRPGWRFEIVGGIEGRRPAASRLPDNVAFLGERPYREMPQIRSRFDVEVIPFRLSELTHATDPVKLYEALAAGRGVVATPMRALEPLAERDLVRLAATPEDFVRQIASAAAAGGEEIARRRAFARENTWDARARELSRRLTELWPLVSILVVTHDGLGWTRLCLESIDRRTDWPRFEVIVADNASTDGTREWLGDEERRGNLRAILLPENRSFAAGVNAAAAASRGEFLCILNNDTVVTRGWLSALVRHVKRDSSIGMIGPSTNEIANEAKVEVGYRELRHLDSWARGFTRSHAGRAEPIPMLAMFCALLSREVFERTGPLDERFEIGMFEDDDYARRLTAKGLQLAVARDSFVHHAGRGSFRALSDERYRRIFEENRRRYEEKWGAPPRAATRAPESFDEIARRAEERGAIFVFPPSIGWDVALVQRPHHLARAFAKLGFPVIFEEESGTRDGSAALRSPTDNLWICRGAARDEFPGRIVWAFTYNVPEKGGVGDARLVYDVIDHPDVFPYPERTLRRNHDRALEAADAVFVVSEPLLDEVRRRRADAVYLPNGVDFARFAAPPDPNVVPEEVSRSRARGRPSAGYVGALARWVDSDLLAALAELRPDWDFFLVGESLDSSFERFERARPANLHLLGPRPYGAIPSILSAFDAGLIPFRRGAEGSNASPIKLYEYLAAALPILATPIPECEAVPEVEVASSASGFSDLLDRARGSHRSEDFRRRARDRARQNDWSERARTALATLGLPAPVG